MKKRLLILLLLLGTLFAPEALAKEKPTLFTIGDSTVKNGRGDGSGGQWGWGDLITHYFDTTKVMVKNHALGGTSSRTYQTRGLWQAVLDQLEKGDFVLMQFGHNDGGAINDTLRARGTIKGTGEETEEINNLITKQHEIVHSYGWYLRKMVREAKAKGATPIIVTPIPRNDWEEGKVKRTPDSYPDWAIEIARQEKAMFIDLNKSMSEKLDSYGEALVTGEYFYAPDHTHTSAEGAALAAALVIDGIKAQRKCKLNRYLLKNPAVPMERFQAPTLFRFDFGKEESLPGYIPIPADSRYTSEKGFGLLPSGEMKAAVTSSTDLVNGDYLFSDKPFYFLVDLPEGRYQIDLWLTGAKEGSSTAVKAESRRLLLQQQKIPAGETIKKTIVVDVRTPKINDTLQIRLKERELNYLNWDNKLTLEFNGRNPAIAALEIRKANHLPVIYLAGNSTVTDQENEPWASWGQMFPAFLKPEIAVANLAESGETLLAFKREYRLARILSRMKTGDYLFMEFAHNDQKSGPNHLEPFTSYQQELKYYIAEVRKKGGKPVLVTSTNRRRFDENGKIINTLEEYPEAMRQLAREEGIPLIDLNAMSKSLYEALGTEGSKKAFVHYPANAWPGQTQSLADDTHFNPYGAVQLAKCVANELRSLIPDLAKYLRDDFQTYDPSHPDPVETFYWPESPSVNLIKPDGN